MPSYNCRECNGLLDPTETVRCPHCNEKKPLTCSKCSSAIGHHDIHEIAKLRVKKPLLCTTCGVDNQVLNCGLCNVGLVRSQGVSVSQLEGAKIYHKECLIRRQQAVSVAHKAAPASAGAALLLGILFFAMGTKLVSAVALAAGITLFIGIKVFATIIEPR